VCAKIKKKKLRRQRVKQLRHSLPLLGQLQPNKLNASVRNQTQDSANDILLVAKLLLNPSFIFYSFVSYLLLSVLNGQKII
jgi:hypothetical protein